MGGRLWSDPWRRAGAILLLAPFLGEVMSTSTPPLDLSLPWNLAFESANYGSGALVVRSWFDPPAATRSYGP